MSDAIGVAAGINASLSAKIVSEATAAWGGIVPRSWQVQKFKSLVDSNAVLGFSDNLKRSRYVSTPVLQAIESCDYDGAVSIAYVPPGLGKTTAAYFFLRRHKDSVRGIAICREDRGVPYVTEMLPLLGLSSSSPPSGWLRCLIDALQTKDTGDTRFTYLILDEFVNEVSDRVDSSLVVRIKSVIRNTDIRVIVLTPSKSYADFLLTRNNLVGIIPLKGTYPVPEFPNGEWQNMIWPVGTLKIAAKHDLSLAAVSDQVEHQIDIFLSSLTATQGQAPLTYVKVVQELKEALIDRRTVTPLDDTIAASLAEDENQGCNACVIC